MKQRVVALLVGILALVAPALVSAQTGTMVTTTGVVYVRSISNVTLTNPTMTTPLVSDNLVLVARTTSGIRLDVSSGVFRVREGDNSAAAPISADDFRMASGILRSATILGGNGLFVRNGADSANGNFNAARFLADTDYTTSGGTRISGASDGAARIANSTSSNTYDITLADWGTLLSGESVSVANDGVLTGPSSSVGFLIINFGTDNSICTFALTGTNAPVELNDPGTFCSVSSGTASSINVYYSSGYKIENKRGGTRSMRLVVIGG